MKKEALEKVAAALADTASLYTTELGMLSTELNAAFHARKRATTLSGRWWSLPRLLCEAVAPYHSLLLLTILSVLMKPETRQFHISRVTAFITAEY
jgi:hypothetical protein